MGGSQRFDMKRLLSFLPPLCLLIFAAAGNAQPLPSLNELADKAYREGYDHHVAGRYNEAVDAYSRSIRIRAGNAAVWFNRGLVYLKLGQDAGSAELYLKAVADFTEALKITPGNALYLKSRGNTYYSLRSTDPRKYAPLAVSDYTEYLRSNPDDGNVFRRRGEAYGDMNDTAKAQADFAKAISIDPRDKLAYFRRGVLRSDRGLSGAREDFEAALRIDPNDADARRWLDWVNSKAATAATNPAPSPVPVAANRQPVSSAPTGADKPASTVSGPAKTSAAPSGSGSGEPWEAPVAEAKRLIAAGQNDRAIAYLRSEVAKVPVAADDLANLFHTRHRSLLQEQMARAQLA